MHQVSLETICPLKAFQLHYCPDDDAKSIMKHFIFLHRFSVLRGVTISSEARMRVLFLFLILVADTRLYTLVRRSVTFLNSERFSHYCSCPTVRDWIAVYPALFIFIYISIFIFIFNTFRLVGFGWANGWKDRRLDLRIVREGEMFWYCCCKCKKSSFTMGVRKRAQEHGRTCRNQ